MILDILENVGAMIDNNTLNFRTFIALLEADTIQFSPKSYNYFSSAKVDAYIQKQIKHHKDQMTYKDLLLIQRLFERHGATFSDSNVTYKMVTEMSMSKALSDVKKINL